MRVLAASQKARTPARYRRFVQRVQVLGLFPDHLAGGAPYLALNGIVLTATEAADLRRLTEVFFTAFCWAGRALAPDVPRLVDMGFPWSAAELLAAEPVRPPLVGRFDFLRDEAGHWWLLEFNADTPSGIREAIVADELVYRELASNELRSNHALSDRLTTAFLNATKGLERGSALGLLTDVSELEDLAQMAYTQALLAPTLAPAGIEVILGDSDNLSSRRGRTHLLGRPVDALYRYVSLEAMYGTRAFAMLCDGVLSGRLRLLNGLFGLLLQHKGVLAWLWAHRDDTACTPEERKAITEHLPPTWNIEELPDSEVPATLVVKQVFGREGEEVYFGDRLTGDDWATLRRRRTYVAQRRIASPAFEALVPVPGTLEVQKGYATVGCFAVEGRWAGYYTRFGGAITDFRAKWFATFEEV